jgi:putative ABC transport system ATP-binding protein
LIQLQNVSKHYNMGGACIRALDGVSLSVSRGEFLAVVGRSGSGKSTLMNVLGCLDKPTSGRYLLEGKDIGSLSVRELSLIRNRQIGFVFQSFNLIPRLTALENVELPLAYAGVPRLKRRALSLEAFSLVGLSDRAGHHPPEMSGGQQQRVAIARAIVTNPPLILADEPTGNLDHKTGQEVLNLLKRLWEAGRTLVLITHDPAVAAQAGRMVTLEVGKISRT